MKNHTKVFHLTLGPVQGFVSQSRRTRDLWAGSFLLSYLSGQAMKAVLDGGGEISFPEVGTREDPRNPLLAAILEKPLSNDPKPEIGSLPNRFKAQVPEGFDPKNGEEAIQSAWKSIADKVRERYVEPVSGYGNGTEEIWERQVAGFWETSWVVGPDPGDRSDQCWLDRRKNWRTHVPPKEPGDKCTLMGSWQELSGYVRARKRAEQEKFWQEVREKTGGLNLGEHERLCAIALIKRLFPEIAKEAVGWELNVKTWPSTPYMAAVPWIEEAHEKPEAQEYLRLVEESESRSWAFGEYNARLQCLRQAGKFARLDGNFFHGTALENERAMRALAEDERKRLLEKLSRVNEAVGRPASPFYALLLMDGDRLGSLLQNEEIEPEDISRALAEFTSEVDGIVRNHCGRTIYAGGDDVLALLPLDRALDAATELRRCFLEAFEEVLGSRRPIGEDGKPLKTTISAGLVFAHYNTSLRAVTREAHHLLDEVAKDRNGRDSLAVSVLTGGGRTIEWVSGWDERPGGALITQALKELGASLDEQFAGRFFYNARERFKVLAGEDDHKLIPGLDAEKLLVAEYLKSGEHGDTKREDAEERVRQLLRVCRRRKGGEEPDESTLDVSGALLVRFLATRGRGVER